MRRINDGAPTTEVNNTAPVSQTGQTKVVRKISIPLIVMQQHTTNTHKEALFTFNFPTCIPVPNNNRTPGAHFPDANLRVGALHIKHRWADRPMSVRPVGRTRTAPSGLPKKAICRYRARND